MNPTIRIANEQDRDAIAKLIYETYALELGQYTPNESERLTDRLHDTNLYILAYMQDELVGMLSMTLPSTASFSTLKRLPFVPKDIEDNLHKTAEIRLLAVKPAYRGEGVFDHLMKAAIMNCYQQGVERVLISAIENRVPLYQFMGFKPIGKPVLNGTAVYVPMLITRQSLATSPYMQKMTQREAVMEMA